MSQDMESFREQVLKLTQVGIALTAVHELDQLLEMIVREARAFTSADAGSLYLREGDSLRFAVSQNETLSRRLGPDGEDELFSPFTLPITEHSIAGYVAVTRKNLNIPDAYSIPREAPYGFNTSFDERNDYRTRSILTVPMLDHRGQVLGVLQLINATVTGQVVPFEPEREDLVRSLASQAAVAVNNARLTSEIKRIHLDTIYRLAMAAEYKDKDTAQHVRRVSNYSASLARRLGWGAADVELMLYASPMHDVGKIGIADAILLKPGRLTPEEREAMQHHTTIGSRILAGSESPVLQMSELVAWTHHEKWDGSGYPRGLKGKDIPQAGRIVAVADVFDALISKRVYKGALGVEETLGILRQDAGKHFDPEAVEAFAAGMDEVLAIRDRYRDEEQAAKSECAPAPGKPAGASPGGSPIGQGTGQGA
ncbi:MAG TPA: GAF domain-containing protein [Myxococcota bacterium]|nr:GAF domain-containing protein [Myxococcota bacterium]HRY96704.1 GAF domain-containing protein [Myxococcota bacterium]